MERLRPGAILAAGDRIQIAYTAGSATHGVILSVDGRGVVTLHHPARLHETTALEPFGRQLLPYSFELDGAPLCERFFFVTGDQPIDVAAVTAAGRATAMGALTATRCLAPTGLLRASLRSGPASGGDCFAPSGSLARGGSRRWEPVARRAAAAAASLGSPAACARDVVLLAMHHRRPEKIDHLRLLG